MSELSGRAVRHNCAAENAPEPAHGAMHTVADPLGMRQAVLRSAAHYSAATVFSQASGLVRAWMIARALGPAAAGVWIGLQLIVSYGANAHLGAVFGMHRHVPLLRGRGDWNAIDAVKRTTFTFTLVMAVVSATMLLLLAFGGAGPLERRAGSGFAQFAAGLRQPDNRMVLLGMSGVVFANLLRGWYVTSFKADNRFGEVSVALAAGGVVGFATLPMIAAYGLAGAVWSLFVMIVAEVLLLAVRAGFPRPSLSWTVLRAQLAFGVLTLAISLAATFLTSIDRIVLIQHFSAEARGLYYPALLVALVFYGLTAVPNSVIYPRLSERYGATGSPEALMPIAARTLAILSAPLAWAAASTAVGLPFAVDLLLPRFTAGVPASQFAMAGIYCYVIGGVLTNVFYALDRQWHYLGILGVSALASFVSAHLLARLNPDLVSVALGVSAGLLLHLVLAVAISWHLMGQSAAHAIRMVWRVLFPAVVGATTAAAIISYLPQHARISSLPGALLAEVLVLVLFSPLLIRAVGGALRP